MKGEVGFGHWSWNENSVELGLGLGLDLGLGQGKVDAVLVDIDGVISDASQRQHFLMGKKKDWKGFFAACVEDEPIYYMTELLNWLNPELKVVLLTARPHWIYDETLAWINRNSVRWDLLVMRKEEQSNMAAKDFKAGAVKNLWGAGFNFLVGFEDDPQNVKTLENPELMGEARVPCVYVHSGYYEGKESSDPLVY